MSDYDDQKVFSTMCRLCLRQHLQLLHLYSNNDFINSTTSNSDIVQMIERFTTIKIYPMDYLPQKICQSCLQTIESMQAFQDECRRNDEELQRRIKDLVETKSDLDEGDTKDKIEMLDVVNESDTKSMIRAMMDLHGSDTKEMLKPADAVDFSSDSNQGMTADPAYSSISDEESARKRNSKRPTKKVVKRTKKPPKSRLDGTKACYICGKRYQNYKYQYHINMHKGLKPFACPRDNCSSTFAAPYELQAHERVIHFKKPEFFCDVCGKAFKRKPSLRIHLSYHFDPKIPCTICQKLFKNDHALAKHMLVHSQERNFRCETCGKSFQTRYTLRVHKRIHTQEKPYLCQCGVSFAYKCSLKAHADKYHQKK